MVDSQKAPYFEVRGLLEGGAWRVVRWEEGELEGGAYFDVNVELRGAY